MEGNSVIIGIPVCNDLECLRETLKSIFESTKFFKKIVLIDSSDDPITDRTIKIKKR